jgi:hypothetical protein
MEKDEKTKLNSEAFRANLERMDWENALRAAKEMIRQAKMMEVMGYEQLHRIKDEFYANGWASDE